MCVRESVWARLDDGDKNSIYVWIKDEKIYINNVFMDIWFCLKSRVCGVAFAAIQ